MEHNPYQTPKAQLGDEADNEATFTEGSLERALVGDYEISISGIRREAWRLTKGNKGKLWLAFLAAGIIQGGGTFLLTSLGLDDGQADMAAGDFIVGYGKSMFLGVLLIPVSAPLTAGILMLSIKRVGGLRTGVGEVFAYYGQLPKLLLISIMSALLVYLGFALLVIPGIYLSVAFMFAIPLMLDKGLSPWQSLEASRKSVTHHWFSVFGAMFVLYLMTMLLAVTLVGIIWALPMMMLGLGLLYRTIFGFGPEDGDQAEVTPQA